MGVEITVLNVVWFKSFTRTLDGVVFVHTCMKIFSCIKNVNKRSMKYVQNCKIFKILPTLNVNGGVNDKIGFG